jgi:dihydrodipicolinate synthase/N-acetylneuraminate lyase
MLGRIPSAYVRPPLTPVSDDERHHIRLALREARLL